MYQAMWLRPRRNWCLGVSVWDSAGGWSGLKEASPRADYPYHLLRLSRMSHSLHCSWDCQRKPAVPYPEEKQMNWCFSGVDAQWLEVMEVAELAHRLDEGLTAQTEHHPISPILSYVSVTLSHYQRARSRKLPGNSTVTPVLTDLGM